MAATTDGGDRPRLMVTMSVNYVPHGASARCAVVVKR